MKLHDIINEEQLDESIKTTAALMVASTARYLGGSIPFIKDTGLIKKAQKIEQDIILGRNIKLSDMENLRKKVMDQIEARPGHERRRIKTYMTKLENKIKVELKYSDDYDELRSVLKRGEYVMKIAKEIDRLGLDYSSEAE